MRVNERKEKINFKLSIIAGLASSIIFSWLGSQSLNGGAGAAVPGIVYYPVISLLLGFLLICSLAFCYDESTKMYGVFLVTFIIPLLLSCIILLNILFLDFVFYGIVAGMVVSGYFLVNHHHEIFSRYVKVLLTLFAAFLLFIVLYNFVLFILANGFVGAYENYKLDFISYIVNTVIVVALYWFVVRKIKGINGSQVFVFGPSRSGKTYFMLGMYKQFVDFFEGHPREVIFSGVLKKRKISAPPIT